MIIAKLLAPALMTARRSFRFSAQKKELEISHIPFTDSAIRLKVIHPDHQDMEETNKELRQVNELLVRQLQERTSQLEQSNKEREELSYAVSHDLRAPLRIVTGYAQLLAAAYGDKIDAEGREFVTAIVDNTKYMGRLIDDLISLSRMDREAVNKTTVDMNTLTHVTLHEMKMNDDTITADVHIRDLKPCVCDQALIRQVWKNLLSNAIKFSRNNEKPEIEIGSYIKGDSTVYYIKDNGAGFDMKFAAKLFGVFVRLHDRSEFEGTGVGLSLVHRIVSKHGGKVWANGKVNEGAVFYFSLPNA